VALRPGENGIADEGALERSGICPRKMLCSKELRAALTELAYDKA